MKRSFLLCFLFLLFTTRFINAQIPKEGLVAYYPFNGNSNDESGNGYNASSCGASLTTDRFGNINRAYNFGGSSYLIANASGYPAKDRTVSLWFYCNTVAPRPVAIGYGGDGNWGTSFFMGINQGDGAEGTLQMQSHGRINRILYHYYNTPPIGRWYHWVLTVSGGSTVMYLNGGIVARGSWTGSTVVNGRNAYIGVAVNSDGIGYVPDGNESFWNGKLDDVRIYNRALSSSEVVALYREENPLQINLLSPLGGEKWKCGTNHNISWSGKSENTLKIEYSTNSGNSWSTVATGIPAQQQSYNWKTPDIPSSNYKIRLTDQGNASSYVTSGIFTIDSFNVNGTVKDICVNLFSNTITNPSLISTIKLFKADALISSVLSASDGSFSFTIPDDDKYRLEISKTGTLPGSNKLFDAKIIINDVVRNSDLGEKKLPFNLLGYNWSILDSLEAMKVKTELWEGLFQTIINIKGYNVNNIRNLLPLWSTLQSDSSEAIANKLMMLLVAEHAIKEYYKNESVMAVELMKSLYDFAKPIACSKLMQNKIKSLAKIPFLKRLMGQKVNGHLTHAKLGISYAGARIKNPNGSKLISFMNTVIQAASSAGENQNPEQPLAKAKDLLDEWIKSVILPIGTKWLLQDFYIPVLSQKSLNYAETNSRYSSSSGLFSAVSSQTNQKINNCTQVTASVKNQVENLRNASSLFSAGSDITAIAAAVSALTGQEGLAFAFASLVRIEKALSYTTSFGALALNGAQFFEIPADLSRTVIAGFPPYSEIHYLPKKFALSTGYKDPYYYINRIQSDNDSYNSTLSSILNFIRNGQTYSAFSKIYDLVKTDSSLNLSVGFSVMPVFSIASDAGSVSGFDNMFADNSAKVGNSFENRSALYTSLMTYMLDTTNTTYRDSVLYYGGLVTEANNSMSESVSQLNQLTKDIPKPAIIFSTGLDYPGVIKPSSAFNIKVKFKNTGGFRADSLYLKLRLSTGYSSKYDSVYVGSLNVNAEDSVTFNIFSPSADSAGYFNIEFVSPGSYSQPAAGSLTFYSDNSENSTAALTLSSGWNLVSVPVKYKNMLKSELFTDAQSYLFGFGGNGYELTDTLKLGRGYWIKCTQPEVLFLAGTSAATTQIPLVPGWNLIGTYDKKTSVTSITTDPSGIISSQFYEFANAYKQADTLKPGKGYWVKSLQNGTLNLQQASGKVNSIIPVPIKNNWGKISITDNRNITKVIYSAEPGEDLAPYELPPLPPQGIFDLRFSTGRYVEQLRGNSVSIIFHSADYPVRIMVEGMELKITDALGGKIIDKILKNGQEFILSNKEIDRLNIEMHEVPGSFMLYQNYPNPFNPVTLIKYSIPAKCSVSLIIYNQLGERVKELVDEIKDAGEYHAEWNAENIASGIYFYELRAGDFRSVKKLMLLK